MFALFGLCITGVANAIQTPALIAAIQANDLNLARRLAKEPNVAEPDGTTALHWAVRNGNLKRPGCC